MRFDRVLVAFGSAAIALSLFGVLHLACSDPTAGVPDPPSSVAPTVTISPVGAPVDQVDGTAGSTFLLTVRASSGDAGVQGLSVAFSAQTAGVTVSPSAVATDATGQAKAYAFVPYDVQGVVLASGGGSLPAVLTLPNGAVTFDGGAGAPVGDTPSGTTYPVSVTALAHGAAIPGFPVTFTAQPASLSVSPASVTTDDAGAATAYVFVPYDTRGFVLASGAGVVPGVVSVGNGALVLTGSAGTPTDFGPTGATLPITLTAGTPDGGANGGVAGISVGLTVQAPAVLVSAATVTTGATGQAAAFVFLPYNSQSLLVASGGSSLATAVPLSNPPVSLETAAPAPSGAITPTGQYWTVSVTASSASKGGSPVPGLSLAFTPLQPGMPSTSSFVTGLDGVATANVFAPFGPSELVQIVGGGSTTFATVPGAASPITLSPLCWFDEVDAGPGVYQVTTYATVTTPSGPAPVPGVSVAFSVVSPAGTSTTPPFQPATAVTNSAGMATSLVALGTAFSVIDAGGVFEVAVQATAGSSTQVAVIPFGGVDGGCPP